MLVTFESKSEGLNEVALCKVTIKSRTPVNTNQASERAVARVCDVIARVCDVIDDARWP